MLRQFLRGLSFSYSQKAFYKEPDSLSAMEKSIIAVCQMTSVENKYENLRTVTKLVEKASSLNANMIFLPESCDFIAAPMANIKLIAENLDGPLMQAYKDLAKKHRVWISIGGFHELTQASRVFNTQVIINDKGVIKATYRKIHLFKAFMADLTIEESDTIAAGKHLTEPVRTPFGILGLMICYDIRFPQVSSILAGMGATVLTYPSAFTKRTGEAHWETLVRTRAIENQSYVVAAAQVGIHNRERCSYGHAMIVDPWGTVIAECPKYTEGYVESGSLAIAEINEDRVNGVRYRMPLLACRRSDVYSLTLNTDVEHPLAHSLDVYMFSDKTIPRCTIFYQTKHCFAFTNIRCVVPGHVLIASRRIVPRMKNLTPEEIADIFQTSVRVQNLMEIVHEAEASTMVVQDGKDAGQTIAHVHVHILPRKPCDFPQNDEIYDALAKHDREGSSVPLRELADMAAEAAELRRMLDDRSAELSED